MKGRDTPAPLLRGKIRLLLLCFMGLAGWSLSGAPAPGPAGEVHADFDLAVRQARETGKDNLLVFTGLEWEDGSRELRDEVLLSSEFQETVGARFVLTHIDLPETPREAGVSGVEARGYRLARNLKLRIFPSVYLCTTDGRPYALLGYKGDGPRVLVRAIREKQSAYENAMREIGHLQGSDRALALDAWLEAMPEPLRVLHRDKIEDLIASDPEDVTGLRSKHWLASRIPEARQLRYAGKLDESEELYLGILREAKPRAEALQQVYYEMADIHFQRKDYDRLLETLDRAIEAAPQGERREVLDEMMQVFTRQWILMKCKPAEMKAANYDHRKVGLPADDISACLMAIADAKRSAGGSTRIPALEAMERELRAAGRGR